MQFSLIAILTLAAGAAAKGRIAVPMADTSTRECDQGYLYCGQSLIDDGT